MSGDGVPDLAPASFAATCSHKPVLCGSPRRQIAATAPPSSAAGPRFDDASALRLVQKVNGDVNGAMAPESLLMNAADDWAPAVETTRGLVGDCKSFAAEKRRRLIAAGFPAERMFYAVVFREDIGLHALLMVRLDTGDYAMDSREPLVVPWREADYLYVERQAADDPYQWTNLVAPPQSVARVLIARTDAGTPRPTLARATLSTTPARVSIIRAAAIGAATAQRPEFILAADLVLATARPAHRRPAADAPTPIGPAAVLCGPAGLAVGRKAASPESATPDGQPVVVRGGPVVLGAACSLREWAAGRHLRDQALAGLHPSRHRLRSIAALARARRSVRIHRTGRPVGCRVQPRTTVTGPPVLDAGRGGTLVAVSALPARPAPGVRRDACDCPDASAPRALPAAGGER